MTTINACCVTHLCVLISIEQSVSVILKFASSSLEDFLLAESRKEAQRTRRLFDKLRVTTQWFSVLLCCSLWLSKLK